MRVLWVGAVAVGLSCVSMSAHAFVSPRYVPVVVRNQTLVGTWHVTKFANNVAAMFNVEVTFTPTTLTISVQGGMPARTMAYEYVEDASGKSHIDLHEGTTSTSLACDWVDDKTLDVTLEGRVFRLERALP